MWRPDVGVARHTSWAAENSELGGVTMWSPPVRLAGVVRRGGEETANGAIGSRARRTEDGRIRRAGGEIGDGRP